MNKRMIIAGIAVALVLVAVGWMMLRNTQPLAEVEHNEQIDITPEQIKSIRDIGQWEFLSISTEELVDTVRHGVFTDDHLARIYYGTLRLGIDFSQTTDGWLVMDQDTLQIALPRIALLDRQFIDEARTRSFHESGRWTAADREALYERACQRMMQQALTTQNLKTAEENGKEQVARLLQAMGFEHVSIKFQP